MSGDVWQNEAIVTTLFERMDELLPRFLAVGRRVAKRGQRAEDIVHEALVLVADDSRAYDAEKWPDLAHWFCTVIASVAWNTRERRLVLNEREEDPDPDAPVSSRDPERLIGAAQAAEHWAEIMRRVKELLADDRLALRILDEPDGELEPEAVQAKRFRVDLDAIKKARKRIRYAIERVLEEHGKEAVS